MCAHFPAYLPIYIGRRTGLRRAAEDEDENPIIIYDNNDNNRSRRICKVSSRNS